MNNKVLTGLVVILAALLVLESVYLLGTKKNQGNPVNSAVTQPVQSQPSAPTATAAPSFAKQQTAPRKTVLDRDVNVLEDLSAWDPFVDMERMQRLMHRLFDDSFSKGLIDRSLLRSYGSFEPNISIGIENGSYIVKADLPGMEKTLSI